MAQTELAVIQERLNHIEAKQEKYKAEIDSKLSVYDKKLSNQAEEIAVLKTKLESMSEAILRTEKNTEKIANSLNHNKDYFLRYLITTAVGMLLWAFKDYIAK